MIRPSTLVPADETLNHQTVDTFASVGQTDVNWTERIWVAAHLRDGSFQLVLGLGKYTNRGVVDAFAGIRCGEEQWTVRGSRSLHPRPDATVVGPIRYEVLEPLGSVRCVLDRNDVLPIRFDLTFRGVLPAALNTPWPERSENGYRIRENVLRYHQIGTTTGWAELEGRRIEVSPEEWPGFRDHSWGVRAGVGQPAPGLLPPQRSPSDSELSVWFPALMERTDGSRYGLFVFFRQSVVGGVKRELFQGHEQLPSGEEGHFGSIAGRDLRYDHENLRPLGGTIHVVDHEGRSRPIEIRPVSETSAGFRLGTGLYLGFDGHFHGDWRGELVVEGERMSDLGDPAVARRLHQLQDTLVLVEDPVGRGRGYGNLEGLVLGGHPDMGLTPEGSFL